MFADGLCERWMMMDKTVLEDPACEECDKVVEVLISSEQQEPHQVTIRVGTSPWLPRVYLKEGQEREDKIYSGGKVEEYWSSYSSSYYNYYDYFWNEILEMAGANVFIRNSGDANANVILKLSRCLVSLKSVHQKQSMLGFIVSFTMLL